MKQKIRRYIGFILALAMCAGMGTTVLGIEDISVVDIYGVVPPVAGETPNTQANVGGTGYAITEMKWIDMSTEEYMSADSIFELGEIYRAYFVVNVSNESEFIFNSVVTVNVNGSEGVVDIVDNTSVFFYYEFSPCPAERVLADIAITNVVPPSPGANPVYNATISEGVILQSIEWGCMDFMGPITPDHVFAEGNTYRIVLKFSVTDPMNYSIGDILNVTVNGSRATEVHNTIDVDGMVSVYFDFPPCGMGPQYLPGDANCDGMVSLADASLILKYIAKWDVTPSIEASDVNKDGIVNLADVSLILKYIAKWNVELK